MKNWLQENTWEEIKELINQSHGIAILPIGSTEQHGFHLPVGTDTYVAIALAEEAAAKANVLAVPPLWFGWSPHHMVLQGTITIRAEILFELVFDVMKSLTNHGIKKFILLNGHRIVNIAWMQLAAERAQRELDVEVKIFDPAYMSKDVNEELGFGSVGHADEIESSHMLYINEKLVRMDKAIDNPVKPRNFYSVDPSYTHDTLCYVPTHIKTAKEQAKIAGGTTGQPSKSSKAKGKIYHDHLVMNLVKIINELKNR